MFHNCLLCDDIMIKTDAKIEQFWKFKRYLLSRVLKLNIVIIKIANVAKISETVYSLGSEPVCPEKDKQLAVIHHCFTHKVSISIAEGSRISDMTFTDQTMTTTETTKTTSAMMTLTMQISATRVYIVVVDIIVVPK